MNSDQEALSRPIGGVGNPSPGNSCQRPQDLIGCVCAALAQLTGEGCYWGDVSQPLLLPLHCSTTIVSLCSFILLFVYFLLLSCFVPVCLRPSIHWPHHLSNSLPFLILFCPSLYPLCKCLHCYLPSLLYPRQPERLEYDDRSNRSGVVGHWLTDTAAGGTTSHNHQDHGRASSESHIWGLGMGLLNWGMAQSLSLVATGSGPTNY